MRTVVLLVICIFIAGCSSSCQPSTRYMKYYLNKSGTRTSKFARNLTCSNTPEIYGIHNDLLTAKGYCTEVDVITFNNSTLHSISRMTFQDFSGLTILHLNSSGVKTFEPAAFAGLTNLKVLHLEQNLIEKIEIGTLNHLVSLETLDISRNFIVTIGEEIFTGLNLTRLFIQKNRLTAIKIGTFSKMRHLQELDLSDNNLHVLHSSTFHYLSLLNFLNISSNHLESIPLSFFKYLEELQVLDLSNNSISSFQFGSLSGLKKLKYFNISSNELSEMRLETLFPLERLKYLNIAYNNLTNLPSNELTTYLPLSHINLDGNNWSCVILYNILKIFRKGKVEIALGIHFESENIHGIKCVNISTGNTTISTAHALPNSSAPSKIITANFSVNNDLLEEVTNKLLNLTIIVLVGSIFLVIITTLNLLIKVKEYFKNRQHNYYPTSKSNRISRENYPMVDEGQLHI